MKAVIRTLSDCREREGALPALAALRIEVFRAWPYLYDGSEAYEAHYLAEFMAAAGSVLVVAEVEGAIVGAATASPMAGQKAEFRAPFEQCGLDTDALFYFGESVLKPRFHGLGIGHGFFDAREGAARAAGASAATFCAVIRPQDHPLRPDDARDLHPFWRARGYTPVEGLTCSFDWKDLDQTEETAHSMQFWMHGL
ncbi:MAG: GNAT family N-acetyltransferase [Sphingobium sp.]|nr:GNAT family N-acetyltransferase [Sphingobium sp.]MBP6111831.1 GNAT family N-acetyltransferase [Sphingobium sp.]MBP8669930.1 GNAT family N-acetyltransferase [Sphingobium sp.]MBP9157861.1 GNAT family N-acetyltransferase [Sphingobium sp.]MCC6482928.1 GNAT family N-acetyltransferase [Sphingomonadaceae bacterium]